MKKNHEYCEMTASEHITQQIAELKGWRGRLLEQLRALILEAEPDITEEWKWGAAIWSKGGTICSAIPFKNSIQLYFFKGASFEDHNRLFNAELDGRVSRAVAFRKGDEINAPAIQDLIREATTINLIRDLFAKSLVEPQPLITQEA